MKLADLQLATELQRHLLRLDEFCGPATLLLAETDVELALSAEETADFVAWKRGRIEAELRRLGIDTGDSPPEPHFTADVAAASIAIFDQNVAMLREPLPAPATNSATLTWDEAYAEARDRVIGAYADSQRQLSEDDEISAEVTERIARYEAHRRTEIEAMAREIMAGAPAPVAPCSQCAVPATATIAGVAYCADHAESAPRPPRPVLVAAG